MALAVSTIAIFMANLDVSIVNIALPSMAKMYGTDATGIASIVQSYMLTITGCLLIGGRLSDAKTAERVLQWGFWIFTASSALCAMAPSLLMLTFFRLLQGIGGAFMFATSSVIVVRYVPSERRGRAFSLNGLMAGVAVAFGAPLGGVLIQYLDWRWIFLINIPIGLAALVVARFAFSGNSEESRGDVPIDWPGGLFSFASLTALLYALHAGEDRGWLSPLLLSLFGVAAIFLVLFLLREKRCATPLLDLSLFRNRPLAAGLAGNFLYLFLVGGITFVLPFYLMLVKGFSPKETGLIMMISPGISIVVSRISGHLSDRIGPRTVCIVAAVAMMLSMIGIAFFDSSTTFAWMAVTLVMLGIGRALYVTAALTMIMTFAEKGKEGMLSAAKALVPNIGSAIGVSLFAILYNLPINSVTGVSTEKVQLVVEGFKLAAELGIAVSLLTVAASLLSDSRQNEPE